MLSSITTAYESLKTALGLIDNFQKLKTDNEISQIKYELNRNIAAVQHDLFQAQAAYASVHSRKTQLEEQIRQLESWETEKERYILHRHPTGTLTYRSKQHPEIAEPQHEICPHCYQQRIKSILQPTPSRQNTELFCPNCHNSFLTASHEKNIKTTFNL